MNTLLTWIAVAIAAVAVAISSIAVSIARTDNTPLGVCVAYDVNTVGTMVSAPTLVDGVIVCEAGTFVNVTPATPTKAT